MAQPSPRPTRVPADRRLTRFRRLLVAATLLALGAVLLPACGGGASGAGTGAAPSTVWLCRPGTRNDPCASSLAATVLPATGPPAVIGPAAAASPRFDCFYIYPTVSRESQTNADLRIQQAEIEAAEVQASPFSTACRVWAPVYRQVTMRGLVRLYEAGATSAATRQGYRVAFDSIRAGFEDYLQHYNEGRPVVLLAHSQGSILAIELLQRMFDGDPAMRSRLAMAIIPGGNVTVPRGSAVGGSFAHIPLCDRVGQAGCVIAYSSFPSQPPPNAFFGFPRAVPGGEPVSGPPSAPLQVACVNPAALAGGPGTLLPWFPVGVGTVTSSQHVSTPWVVYPGLYRAACRTGGGASWLQVTPIPGAAGSRRLITESSQLGPRWGYHTADVNLATGNLVADVAATEQTWPG